MITARYRAYPEYKDSGVEWLPNIPVNWEVRRTKAMFSLTRKLVGEKSTEYQLLSLTLKGIIPRDISDGGGKMPAEFNTYQEIKPKDLIFCLFDIDETPRTIGLSSYSGMITGAYNVYKCLEKCLPEYAYYYFMHIDSFKGLRPFYTGLRKVVRAETFGNIKMPAPSFSEQQQIAAFLAHETAKIDTLIEKQQKLIALFKEKRQAVISHAVTKGLNPDAPMKDSGVEWLGDVPAAWLISRIKFFCRLNPSKSETINSMHPDTEVTFLPMEAIGECGQIDRSREKSLKALQSGYTYVGEGDVCIAKITPCFENGKGAIATGLKNGVAFATTEVIPLRCNQIDDSRYLYYLLTSSPFKKIAEGSMYGAGGQKRVSDNFVANYNFPLPPFTERQHIAAFLNNEMTKIDTLINNAQHSIKLSQERRTALISAAVSGKIDVRDWQPPPTHKEIQ